MTPQAPILLAIAPNYWGRGATVTAAKAAMYKAGAPRAGSYYVLLLPLGATKGWVDEFGRISWEGAPEGEPIEVDRYIAPAERR